MGQHGEFVIASQQIRQAIGPLELFFIPLPLLPMEDSTSDALNRYLTCLRHSCNFSVVGSDMASARALRPFR